jgi:hypothetical protein
MYDYEYIMNFGSDDLLHSDAIDLYLPYLTMKVPLFGLKSLWFYEFDKLPFFFSYYNQDHIVGAGRMIHRTVIDKVKQRFGCMYEPDIKRGMDTMSAARMKECGFVQTLVESGRLPLLVDIKSTININSFDSVKV